MKVSASRELLAPREDVWAFLAQPQRLAEWWPGVAAVQPDARGLSAGARWEVRADARAGFVERPGATTHLLVRRAEPPALAAWHLTRGEVDVELRLEDAGAGRTRATLTLTGRVLLGSRRELPRTALSRLYDLCQTGAAA